MARKNRGICGLLGPSWVLISMPPRNSKHHSSILAANASVRYKEAELRELPQAITSVSYTHLTLPTKRIV